MKPRRPALLMVLLAGLGVGCIADEDPPTDEMHERYRVQLDLPPVEAALWFAARYPEYFISGEVGLGPWLDSLDPRDRDFVMAMGQTLMWAWIDQELAGFDQRDPGGLAREATRVIRHKTLNQLDLDTDDYPDVEAIEFGAWDGDPDFPAGVFARLVRGVSNCEGQNHLLAVLLDTALEPEVAGWPEIDAEMVSVRLGHDLVQLQGPTLAQPIYVDAWSNLPAFTLDPSLRGSVPSLASLGESPPPVVLGVAGRAPFPASVYAASTQTPIELLPAHDAPTQPVDLDIRAPPLDEASLADVHDPWQLYLFARILHVYDDPRAADLYRLVVERHCSKRPRPREAFVCMASTALLERLNQNSLSPGAREVE